MSPVAEPPKPASPPPVAVPPPEPVEPSPPAPWEPNPFAEIDAAIERVEPSARPPKPPEPPKEAPKASPEPPKVIPKVDDKNKVTPKESFAELRKRLEDREKELESKNKSQSELEAKIKDFESKGKDTTVLSERLATMEKELAERETQLKALRYEPSDVLKAKIKEFDDTADYAKSLIEQFVIEKKDADGAVIESKPAKWDDFVELYRLPMSKALVVAKEKFGDASQIVISHLTELKRLDRNKDSLEKQERENAAKTVQEHEARAIARRDGEQQARIQVRKDLQEKDPFYRDPPEDKESSELRNKYYAIYDQSPASPAHKIVKEEATRHIVAAHGPMKLKIARLEAELKKYKDDEKAKTELPGKTHRGGGGESAKSEKTWEEEARELDL